MSEARQHALNLVELRFKLLMLFGEQIVQIACEQQMLLKFCRRAARDLNESVQVTV